MGTRRRPVPTRPPHQTAANRLSAIWQLPAETGATRLVRHQAAATLRDWGIADGADDAVLLIDELLTNAAVHATGPITLRLRLHPGGDDAMILLCEVTDTSHRPPHPRSATTSEDNGRGLLLIAALATSHGWHPTPSGKTVWFTHAR